MSCAMAMQEHGHFSCFEEWYDPPLSPLACRCCNAEVDDDGDYCCATMTTSGRSFSWRLGARGRRDVVVVAGSSKFGGNLRCKFFFLPCFLFLELSSSS